MDLMEYQGKELFRRYGIPTSTPGEVARTPDEVERLAAGRPAPVASAGHRS